MFKKRLIGVLAVATVIAVSACTPTATAAPESTVQTSPVVTIETSEIEPPNAQTGPGQPFALAQSVPGISAQEVAGLLYMYEEEKLARDIYTSLYALWGQPAFQNIAASEQVHMKTVETLLVRYDLTVPGSVAGNYTDASLQALYDTLMARGRLSLADALKVGAVVEEVDILDLQSRLAQTNNTEIQLVYSSLLNGSYNHLRSFTAVLVRQFGEVYQPQYLSQDSYQLIVNSDGVVGNRGQGNGYKGGRP